MSLRNYRKIYGAMSVPPPDSSSEEEYVPSCVKNSSKSNYAALKLSSSSESNGDVPKEEKAEEDEFVPPEPTQKKKKLKIKKKNRGKIAPKSDTFEMDEIDKSIMEVNAMLGEPSQKAASPVRVKVNPMHALFSVRFKHLYSNYELNTVFGPDTDEEENIKKRDRDFNLRCAQRGSIVPGEYIFHRKGITMSVNRREEGYTYFTFDHSLEYQERHKHFLYLYLRRERIGPSHEPSMIMHVEELIQEGDYAFMTEDYTNANTLIEQLLAYMQHCTAPFFNITNVHVRLEYKYLENRAFHVLLMKYLYLLTNKACHRTALEVAKLLFNLDPTDPLAVMFILDTLALRAREHQWLIDTIDLLTVERDAGYMFNSQLSYALANYHVITNNKGDLQKADELLKTALLKFPSFVMDLLQEVGQKPSEIVTKSVLFNEFANTTTNKSLMELINIYAMNSSTKWRESDVLAWFVRNVEQLADEYDEQANLREEADTYSAVRNTVYRIWPEEITRHMCCIKAMASLIYDKPLPSLPFTASFDPIPPNVCVDRYDYNAVVVEDEAAPLPSIFGSFFQSLFPAYELPQPNIEMPQSFQELYFEAITAQRAHDAERRRLEDFVDNDTDDVVGNDNPGEENETDEYRYWNDDNIVFDSSLGFYVPRRDNQVTNLDDESDIENNTTNTNDERNEDGLFALLFNQNSENSEDNQIKENNEGNDVMENKKVNENDKDEDDREENKVCDENNVNNDNVDDDNIDGDKNGEVSKYKNNNANQSNEKNEEGESSHNNQNSEDNQNKQAASNDDMEQNKANVDDNGEENNEEDKDNDENKEDDNVNDNNVDDDNIDGGKNGEVLPDFHKITIETSLEFHSNILISDNQPTNTVDVSKYKNNNANQSNEKNEEGESSHNNQNSEDNQNKQAASNDDMEKNKANVDDNGEENNEEDKDNDENKEDDNVNDNNVNHGDIDGGGGDISPDFPDYYDIPMYSLGFCNYIARREGYLNNLFTNYKSDGGEDDDNDTDSDDDNYHFINEDDGVIEGLNGYDCINGAVGDIKNDYDEGGNTDHNDYSEYYDNEFYRIY